MDTALNLHCPTCGAVIASILGSRAGSLRQAVELQATRFGTEVTCRECGGMHVILRTEAAQNGASPALLRLHDAAAGWSNGTFGEPQARTSPREAEARISRVSTLHVHHPTQTTKGPK